MATSPKSARVENDSKASAGSAQRAVDPAADMQLQIQALKDEIAKLRAQVASSGGRSYDALKNIAADGAEQLRVQGEAAMDGLRDNARDLEAQMAATVREKPVTSLAIAAGVGFLFALLARR